MNKMLKPLAIAALSIAILTPAHAEIYTYACQVPDERGNVHLYSAKLDTGNRTITWRGKVFKNLKHLDGCKQKYQATSSDGHFAELCTATQGVATLEATFGGPHS